jgi:hypothetical protein
MGKPIYRLYTIISTEAVQNMKGNRGRMVTQGAHGYLHAFWDAETRYPEDAEAYRSQPSAFKVTLVAKDGEHLRALASRYRNICGVAITEETGSRADGSVNEEVRAVTDVGIGPLREDLVGDDIRALKPFL